MYNKSQKNNENENIFDKQMKSGKQNKLPVERNTFEANNIADTITSDAFPQNTGRRGKFADENDNELFKMKEYSKIMKSIETEGFYSHDKIEENNPVVFELYENTKQDNDDIDEINRSFFFPTPKTVRQNKINDLTPMCIVKIKSIGGVRLSRPLLCLLDTGASCTMIQRGALPYGCVSRRSLRKQMTTTANGTFDSSESVSLEHISLPEFVNG